MQFNVPKTNIRYQLEKDFEGFTAGSIFEVGYPAEWGFTFKVFKKYNIDTPATKFGQRRLNIIKICDLCASEYKLP